MNIIRTCGSLEAQCLQYWQLTTSEPIFIAGAGGSVAFLTQHDASASYMAQRRRARLGPNGGGISRHGVPVHYPTALMR